MEGVLLDVDAAELAHAWPMERAWAHDLEAGAAACEALSRLARGLPCPAMLTAVGPRGDVLTVWVVGKFGRAQTLYDFTRAHRLLNKWPGDAFDPFEGEPHSGSMAGFEGVDPFALMDLNALAGAHWNRLAAAAPALAAIAAREAKSGRAPWSLDPHELALAFGWPECSAWMERARIASGVPAARPRVDRGSRL